MNNYLENFLKDFASSIVIADKREPQYISRNGKEYQKGIGPHTEDKTVELTINEFPNTWDGMIERFIPFPENKRWKCDLCINTPEGKLFIEIKMMRLFGDNGKTNDNITMHILSPYPQHRSALTDIKKLKESGFDGRKAIVIYGYDYDDYPLKDMMKCFENLAGKDLEERNTVFDFSNLIHPIHQKGQIYGWMINE